MEAKELRIGNILSVDGEELSVCQINDTLDINFPEREIIVLSYKDGLKYTSEDFNIKPIPLTEEWLIKLGILNHILLHEAWSMWLEWNHDYKELVITDDDDEIIFAPSVLYVHQLQNLYFALTGKELEVK